MLRQGLRRQQGLMAICPISLPANPLCAMFLQLKYTLRLTCTVLAADHGPFLQVELYVLLILLILTLNT